MIKMIGWRSVQETRRLALILIGAPSSTLNKTA
jgi:hypothetical protein